MCVSSRVIIAILFTASQVAPLGLFPLNGLEQALEVASAEALKLVALDDLDEDGGAVHEGLGEELEQVALLVVVDEDVEALDGVEVLLELPAALLGGEALAHGGVVRGRDADELDAAGAHGGDGGQDVAGQQGNVLDAGAGVEDDELLDLRLLLARRRLVDGHLDHAVGRAHDDRVERAELGADLRVVDAPEPVELQALLVEGAGLDHLVPVLVADAVVDADQVGRRHLDGARGRRGRAEPGQERARVGVARDEGMCRVAICADDGRLDGAVLLVVEHEGLLHRSRLAGECSAVDCLDVVNLEGNVLDGITMPLEVGVHLLEQRRLFCRYRLILGEVSVRADGGCEDESDIAIFYHVGGEVSAACLQALVGYSLEAKEGVVICCRLLGVANPPSYVVVTLETGNSRLHSKGVNLAVSVCLICLEEGIFPGRGCRDS